MTYKKPTGRHIKVWEETHGCKVPKGYAVHHKDKDTSNNNPDNLEALPRGQHQRDHMLEKLKDPLLRKIHMDNFKKTQKAAKAWHKSKEGREWHKEHYKNSLPNATKYKRICVQCGKEYYTTRLRVTRFCHHRCSQNYYAKKRREVKNNGKTNI